MEENDDHERCQRGMYMEIETQRIKKKEIMQNKNTK